MNLTQLNVFNTLTTTVKYNVWGNKRIDTGIGNKIRIRFNSDNITIILETETVINV